jgi:hypothetical protein
MTTYSYKQMRGLLPMSTEQILAARDAGRMTHDMAGWHWSSARECEDCGATLPQQGLDGSADTFPRCSAHAF